MKNLTLILLLCCVAVAGQNKITFTNQVDYVLVEKNSYSEKVDSTFIKTYYTTKGDIVVVDIKNHSYPTTLFPYKGKVYEVDMHNNQIQTQLKNRETLHLSNWFIDVQRTNKTDEVNGVKCNYYTAHTFDLCMVENHKINTFSFLNNTLKDKGLLLKIKLKNKEEPLIYLGTKNIHKTVYFDVAKELAKHKKAEKEWSKSTDTEEVAPATENNDEYDYQ